MRTLSTLVPTLLILATVPGCLGDGSSSPEFDAGPEPPSEEDGGTDDGTSADGDEPDAEADAETSDGETSPSDADAGPSPTDAGDDADADDGDAGEVELNCPEPPPNACEEVGATRCASGEDEVVERCRVEEGCRRWVEDETCLDDNACTGEPDVCQDGACVAQGESEVSCDPAPGSCMSAECDPATGECVESPKPAGAPCDDGNVCTEGDTCFEGECDGNSVCPKSCQVEGDLGCGSATIVSLSDAPGTNVMSAYGCDDFDEPSHGGFERAFKVKNTEDYEATLTVAAELVDPALRGSERVDIFVLGTEEGICWPEDCVASGTMNDQGRATATQPLASGEEYIVVVDGRDGFSGEVRVAADCAAPDLGTVGELFCTNGEDDDGDGTADCGTKNYDADSECAGTPICEAEHACDDGLDNDDDGQTDCDDDDCADLPVCDVESACDDGVDNDGDGQTDCDDEDCSTHPACGEVDCDNDEDDDGDGQTDCDDEDCEGAPGCSGACESFEALSCGDTRSGETVADGGTDTFTGTEGWKEQCEENESGFEETSQDQRIYAVELPSGEGTLTVDGQGGAFDALVTAPTCGKDGCLQAKNTFFSDDDGDGAVAFDVAGQPWVWLVVTPSQEAGASQPFGVEVSCPAP